MRNVYLAILGIAFSFGADAQTADWSKDVAPIIYNRCATCHRDGGVAPFPLTSYNNVIAHASSVRGAVQSNRMPPWPPDATYSRLAHERVLSSTEKSKILDWLNNGRPRGNTAFEPPTPTFSDKGDLPGTPDMVLKIPTYTSNAAMGDMYRCFVLPTGLTSDQFITSFEALPGNRSIVHHVLVFADTTGVTTALDAADPGPGYTSFGGIGTSKGILLGGWVPGSSPTVSPAGFGMKLHKDAKIVIQIHYPAGSAGQVDSTEVHFFFSPTQNVRNLMLMPLLNHVSNINAPLFIPANTVKEFTEQQGVPFDFTLFGVSPHMHLLGTKIECFGVAPEGDTQKFISIPNWDFHWQGYYMFRQAKKVKGMSMVYAKASFDNTVNNPMNPSNPPKDVSAGEATTDEMMLVYCLFSFYENGDENIVIENTPAVAVKEVKPYYKGVELLQPYPVPANKELVVKYHLDEAGSGSLELVNMSGQVCLRVSGDGKLAKGYTAMPVDVSGLAAGAYTLRLSVDGEVRSRMVSVVR
jgi:hypothetical protein